jgi:ribokinase
VKLPASTASTLLVVGDAGLDLTVTVDHRPGTDEKVLARAAERGPGGVAANTAVAAAQLGMPTRLVARVGADAFGTEVLAGLKARHLDVSLVAVDRESATYYSIALVDPSGEKALVVIPGPGLYPSLEQVDGVSLARVNWIHTVPYAPSVAARLAARARTKGIRVSVDLEPATLDAGLQGLEPILRSADTVFVNTRAVAALGGNETDVIEALRSLHVSVVVLTRGEAGCRVWNGSQILSIPAFPVRTIDTTGAGDSFAASYICARLWDYGMGDAAEFASVAAGISCTGLGAQSALPAFADVAHALAKHRDRASQESGIR